MASQNLAAMLQQGKAAEVERICLQEFKKRGGIEFQMLSYYVQATVSLGKIDQTIELLKNMSAKMPDHGGLQDQLARLYSMKGDMDLALEHSDMAIAKAPDVPDFYNGRGNLFKYMNRFEEAREAYQKTVELGPQLPMAHLNLGRVLLKLERFEEAEKCFARALELSGDELALYSGYVGSEFAAIEQYDKARQMYAKGLEQYPEDGFLHEYMGMALRRLSRFEEADAAFRTAARIHPEKSSVYNHWALLKRDNGDFDGAEDLFQKAIKLDEKNAQAYSNYAALMRRKGDLTRANELYEVSLEIAPDAINTHCARAKIHKFEKGDAAFRDLARLLGNEWLSDFDRAKLQLALAKAMEDVGNYPAAFDLASKANVQFKKLRPFDIDKHKNYLVRVAEKFPKASALPPAKPELPRLIQIVGMSRSGKSLVEEVLCHSPEVFGLDEDKGFITEMNAFLGAEGIQKPFPDCIDDLTDEMCARLGEIYLQKLQQRAPKAKYFINTIPASFPFLGLLYRCIPSLVVINCQRDPLDQAIESYFKHYQEGNAYSYDLATTGEFWLHYRSLMRHWQNLYGDKILTVNYEELVEQTEKTIARIFAHCEITPPKSVKDISYHGDNVGRWRHFEAELKPLIRAFQNTQAVGQS